jgi:uncharacterized membrane protein YphA (DoxX/SURF4 family)
MLQMTQENKGRKIAYWVTTVLAGLNMLAGGAADAFAIPDAVAIFQSLSLPVYLVYFIGVAKIAGAIVILAPKLPRLKEWAYAGIAIDLTGAAYAHAASGQGVMEVSLPLVVLALVMTSWWLRPADRKLPDAKPA